MCGITGQFSKNTKIDTQDCLAMSEAIKHRGPDNFGNYFENSVFLGHRLLAIMDSSSLSEQPMWDIEQNIGIVFNGEIYNYKELKIELSEYNFVSNTDTEVLIYGYKKWGIPKMLDKLNGMFSFCIYDKGEKKVFFVRDRVGIKPFTYFFDGENFIFSSEIKSLLKNKLVNTEIDKKSVANYFIYRYIPNPNSIFLHIKKLEPGHFLQLNLATFKLEKQEYWRLPSQRNLILSETEIVEKAQALLAKAVEYRLLADTKVAAFLSGGIDSSVVCALAKNKNPDLEAFTISLQPKQYSEAQYAKNAARFSNIKLITTEVGKENFTTEFENILKFYDEPFADSSFVPTFILCQTVSKANIKCALSGDGGDEVFFGYNWYSTFYKLESTKKLLTIFPKKVLRYLLPLFKNPTLNLILFQSIERYQKLLCNRFTVNEINELFGFDLDFPETEQFKTKVSEKSLQFKDLSVLDFHTFLVDDILYKVDIASMANSLEVRTPFLDHNLVEFMFSVSFHYLFKEKKLKYLLKEISRNLIPESNIFRKKKGFSAPVMHWIDKDFKDELLKGQLVKTGFVNKNVLVKYINEKKQAALWQLYIFEKWFSNYVTDL